MQVSFLLIFSLFYFIISAMNNNIQHRESNISVRQRAAEIDKKEKE